MTCCGRMWRISLSCGGLGRALDHREGGFLPGPTAVEPALAENRELGQAPVKGCLTLGQITDERPGIKFRRGAESFRTDAAVHLVTREAERALQQSSRPPCPGVDAHVEHAQIDPAWKRVGAEWVPVERLVYRARGAHRHVPDLGRAELRIVRVLAQSRQRNPHIGRAARVGWIVDIPTLFP